MNRTQGRFMKTQIASNMSHERNSVINLSCIDPRTKEKSSFFHECLKEKNNNNTEIYNARIVTD